MGSRGGREGGAGGHEGAWPDRKWPPMDRQRASGMTGP